MDKRIEILNHLYLLHEQLLNVYHSTFIDIQLLKDFCQTYSLFIGILKPYKSSKMLDYLLMKNSDFEKKGILHAHLYASNIYASQLIQRIDEDPKQILENEITAVIFDYGNLLNSLSKIYKLPIGDFRGSRNMEVDSYLAFKIAEKFFWCKSGLQRSNFINGYSIFALRQSLELAGKEILGLKSIVKQSQEPDKYTSQIPWDFIVKNKNKEYFKLPFEPLDIQAIYKWSNNFVHTGKDTLCYVTALLLSIVNQLFQKNWIINPWTNEREAVSFIEITNYTALKKDFESYLLTIKPEKRFANWAPSPKLSYISG